METWKYIEGYNGRYAISDHGNLKSFLRSSYGTPMKLTVTSHGYCYVGLSDGAAYKKFFVHRLVAFAFLPPVAGKPFINHIDCNKLNNRVSNLEWNTADENNKHAASHGLFPRGEQKPASKLTEKDVRDIRYLHSIGRKNAEIAAMYPVQKAAIAKVIRRDNWKHVPELIQPA